MHISFNSVGAVGMVFDHSLGLHTVGLIIKRGTHKWLRFMAMLELNERLCREIN
jgi:hypothetical protein